MSVRLKRADFNASYLTDTRTVKICTGFHEFLGPRYYQGPGPARRGVMPAAQRSRLTLTSVGLSRIQRVLLKEFVQAIQELGERGEQLFWGSGLQHSVKIRRPLGRQPWAAGQRLSHQAFFARV